MQKRISKILLSLCIMCISLVAFSVAVSAAYVTYIVGSGSEGKGTVGISTDHGATVTKGDVNKLTVSSGTTVMLYAYPNSGYSVDKIGGFMGSTSASISAVPYGNDGTYLGIFTMGSDDFIGYASFKAAPTYTITAQAENGGTVSGGGTVAEGGSTTLTATANDGYVFAGWYNGSTKVSDSASYTVSDVQADATYTAKFEEKTSPVKIIVGEGGTVLFENNGTETTIAEGTQQDFKVKDDISVTLTAQPKDGYMFKHWSITLIMGEKTYITENPNSPMTTKMPSDGSATMETVFVKNEEGDPVAMVGNRGYASLQGAIDAATSGQIVTLYKDVTSSTPYTVSISSDDNLILDLNGHTISNTAYHTVYVDVGTVTIQNGTIANTFTGTTAGGVFVANNGGNVTLKDVTIEDINICVTGNSGTITVEGNSVIKMKEGGTAAIGAAGDNAIIVNSGTIDGNCAVMKNGTITINGGTFTTDPSAYVAEGKVVTYDGTNYTITDSVPANAVAKVGNSYYTSLREAINAVPADGTQTTITVLSDINESDVVANGNIVIDLDGHKWTAQGTSAIQVASGAVILKNGTVEGGTAGTVITQSGSTTTLDNVTVTGSSAVVAQGTVTIDGNSTVTGSTAALNSYGSIIVNSGVLNGALTTTSGGTITINDGTFTADPTTYVASGTPVAIANDGKYIVNAYRVETATTEGGTVERGDAVKTGGSITLTATPDSEHLFLGWYDGDTKVSPLASYTVDNVTEGKTYTAKFIAKEIVDESAFETTTDSGYYGEYQNPANGIIAFNSFYKQYETANISKFGLYIYVAGGQQVSVEATTVGELKAASGKFYATVSDVAPEQFETQVYAMPYVEIDGTVYYGETVNATVNTNKWLGGNN